MQSSDSRQVAARAKEVARGQPDGRDSLEVTVPFGGAAAFSYAARRMVGVSSRTAQALQRVALAFVLGIALVLRVWAIDWGAPYLYHPDEHLVLHPALNVVRSGDVNPHWFQYPSLLIYVQAALVGVLQPFVHASLDTDAALNRIGPWDALPSQWPFVQAGRLFVALLSVVGIWLVYRVGALYATAPVGIAAALLLAVSPLHNESSHYLTTDVVATTLLTAALSFSVSGVPRFRRLAIAGLFAGLAAATKYTAGVVLAIPLVASCSGTMRESLRRALAVAAAAALGFLLACPFALLDFPAFWTGVLRQRQNYLGGYTPGRNWRWYLDYLYITGLGRPLAVAAAVGLGAACLAALRGRRQSAELRLRLALGLLPVVYFVIVASYPSRAERNLIVLLPFLCVLAADACWRTTALIRNPRAAALAFVCTVSVIAAPSLLMSAKFDRRLTRPDTRTLALQWIDAHLPAGSAVAREEYTPQLSPERYKVTYLWSLAGNDYGWYLSERVDYLVASSNVYGRAMQPPFVGGASGPFFYRFVFDHLPLLAEFTPSADTPGPTIRIYRVPHEADW